jgi:hypothetical protein
MPRSSYTSGQRDTRCSLLPIDHSAQRCLGSVQLGDAPSDLRDPYHAAYTASREASLRACGADQKDQTLYMAGTRLVHKKEIIQYCEYTYIAYNALLILLQLLHIKCNRRHGGDSLWISSDVQDGAIPGSLIRRNSISFLADLPADRMGWTAHQSSRTWRV